MGALDQLWLPSLTPQAVRPPVILTGATQPGSGSSSVVSVTNAAQAGSRLVVCVAAGSRDVPGAVSDSKGNSWPSAGVWDTIEQAQGYWTIAIISTTLTNALNVGDTITVPVTGGGAGIAAVMALEIPGVTASPLDQTLENFTSSGATIINLGTTGTLAQAKEMVVTFCAGSNGSETWTKPSGYTEIQSTAGSQMDAAYKQVNSTAGVGATWQMSPSGNLFGALATYKLS